MTISGEHPFLPPEADRSPVRRLRGRLASPVTLWTAGQGDGRAGLTVSSLLVADGDPGYVAGVLDPLSELWDALHDSGAAVVSVLDWQHRQLADAFGYVAPAPGGPFRLADWTQSEWGPVVSGVSCWAGCRLGDRPAVTLGWGQLVQLEVVRVEFGDEQPPLIHRRGRYATTAPEREPRAPEPSG